MNFKTTYVYIKTHNKTGLKYLGITTKKNVHTYKGSGSYWKKHIKLHGYDVHTEIINVFDDHTSCKLFTLEYSHINDIMNSNEWANLKPEDSDPYGALAGNLHPLYGKKRPRQSMLMTGENNPAKRQSHKDNHFTKAEEFRKEQAERWREKNPMFNEETRKKVSEKLKGPRLHMRGIIKPKKPCVHCSKMCGPGLLDRWHNDNCKFKKDNDE